MEKELRLSVHQLVDFLLRSGDIDNRVFNRSSMAEGSKIHATYQASQGPNYISEYQLSYNFVISEVNILLEGRADGIIKRANGEYVIDEIKSTVEDLQTFKEKNGEWHLGQAKCYAFMFAKEQSLDYIGIKLTYIKQGKEKDKFIETYVFSKEELEQYVYSLLEEYISFYNTIFRRNETRNKSIETLAFPFDKYRKGQRELAKYVYAIGKNGGRFFTEAPTGIGKTMSTLFPYIKAFINDEKTKIFYLTAKTSGKESAKNAIHILKEKGLELTDITITAKEKICFSKEKSCNPDECPFARGYYDKIQNVIQQSLNTYTTFDLQTITEIAHLHEICPFELELDLSLFSDVIICDFNYLFDPIAYMKRYFDEDSSHYLALIDESHNLVDRSKEMYSAVLSFDNLKKAKKSLRHSKYSKLKNSISKVNKMFKDVKESYEDGNTIISDFSEYIYKTLNSFFNTCQDVNKNDHQEMTKEVLDFYLDTSKFLKISDLVNDCYISYVCKKGEDICLHHFCLDASLFLQRITNNIKGSVFFSATLSPINYYRNVLGGEDDDPSLILASPFPIDNLCILVAPKVSIKYKNRENSYQEVADYINKFVNNKIGNYFVYVPSYEYLSRIKEYLNIEEANIYYQNKDMSEIEKEDFLLNFKEKPEKTCIGIMVLGGAFSEGIDLVNDRLIGAIIVGIGMPKINFESDQIAEYYKSFDMPGHDYAYLNPGMNKVMQAVGRVIRSETDRGAVLLIDERYMNRQYQDLYKQEWKKYKVVYSPNEVSEILQEFFKK